MVFLPDIPPISERIKEEDAVNPPEITFRGIMKNPTMWNPERNEFTRAIYKDDRGVSVDIGGDREKEDCINHMCIAKNWFAIRELSVEKINEADCRCFMDLLGGFGNAYHALILTANKNPKLSSSVKDAFLKSSIVIYKED